MILALVAGVPAVVQASSSATIEVEGGTRSLSERDAAGLLFQAGRLEDARKVLLDVERRNPSDSQTEFMLGMVAVAQGDYSAAIRWFRRILAREPGVARVRLELARAFFLKRDYDNAERQFRFARAGRLPPETVANIDRYLFAIRKLRRWSFGLSLGIAPDTNLNAGPTIRQIDLFGLPFELSDQARRQSGVGAAIDASGEWAAPIGTRAKLHVGGQLHSLGYRDGAFDNVTLGLYGGPEFLARRWDISPRATVFRQWYGGRIYNQGAGGSLGGIYYISSHAGLTASIGAQSVAYPAQPEQSGLAVSGSVGGLYTPNPSTVLRANLAISRQAARFAGYAYTAGQLTLGYDRDLSRGFTISIEPSYSRTRYDAPLAAFGSARADVQWTAQVTLLNRRIDWAGFTPRALYAFTRNASNIPLYSYDRSRLEIGLTRVF